MDDAYAGEVLDLVARIPPGRAMTYGLVAEVVVDRARAAGRPARGGPRQVGQVMAAGLRDVPWWRVVDASGRPPARHLAQALAHLRDEGTPLTRDGARVALRAAVWFPAD